MRHARIIVPLAMLIAAAFALFWRPIALEERLVDLQLDQVLPNESRALAAQPLELRALLVEYADDPLLLLQARAALTLHPAMTPAVMLAFGDEPDFRAVLREYGAAMIPPVHFFMHNEVRTLEVMKQVGALTSSLGGLVGLGDVETSLRALPPHLERGWFAIAFVGAEGYSFIGQFVVDEQGHVHWLQTERVLEGINAFFASGIRNLERRHRQGEAIRFRDAGSAAIDVAIGVSVFKLVKAMRSGRVATRQVDLATRSVALAPVMVRQSAVASRLLRIGVPLAAGYLMIRHPSLINSSLAWLAERLDLPVALVQFVGWTLLLLPILYAARLLLWPLARLLDVGARLARPVLSVRKPE
jgi:hypothetical protein